ncbi:hypothetical protein evm_012896 [Chilo suppressalis]|nr:hypothetical protein evm_012896 [Chilo suppressalis]
MAGTLNNGMCRCCASEGSFRDISSKYVWMGEEEIYAEMLRECFDINLVNAESHDGGICEVCITQLRSAANFKKQVQITEEQFKKRINDNMFKNNIVKVEVNMLDEDDHHSDNNDNNLSDDFSGPEFEVPVKTESEEVKGKKRTRATAARTKKAKLKGENDNAESSKHKRSSRRKGNYEDHEKITLNKKLNFSTFIAIKPTGVSTKSSRSRTPTKSPTPLEDEPAPKPVEKPPTRKTPRARPPEKIIQRRLTELDLHYDNIKTVLRCSNATPIRCKVGDRYACSYCLDQFGDPRDLKAHTLNTHSDTDDKPECLCIRSLSKYCVHLDVTNLKCELCDGGMDKLEDLIDHLKLEHDELIHTNIRNLMVPYKFETADVKCVVCLKDFGDYLDLQEHMSDHYKNYVVEKFCTLFGVGPSNICHNQLAHINLHSSPLQDEEEEALCALAKVLQSGCDRPVLVTSEAVSWVTVHRACGIRRIRNKYSTCLSPSELRTGADS